MLCGMTKENGNLCCPLFKRLLGTSEIFCYYHMCLKFKKKIIYIRKTELKVNNLKQQYIAKLRKYKEIIV